MAGTVQDADVRRRGREMAPAQWYCLLAGAALVLAGVLGFVADSSFGAGSDVGGSDLIVFEVNGWHNLVHLLSGAVLLAAAPRQVSAWTIAFGFGLVYGAVAVWGLIDGDTVLGLLPVNGPDHILHVALAAVGLLAALASPRGEALETSTAPATRDTPVGDHEAHLRPEEVNPLTGAAAERDRPTR